MRRQVGGTGEGLGTFGTLIFNQHDPRAAVLSQKKGVTEFDVAKAARVGSDQIRDFRQFLTRLGSGGNFVASSCDVTSDYATGLGLEVRVLLDPQAVNGRSRVHQRSLLLFRGLRVAGAGRDLGLEFWRRRRRYGRGEREVQARTEGVEKEGVAHSGRHNERKTRERPRRGGNSLYPPALPICDWVTLSRGLSREQTGQ